MRPCVIWSIVSPLTPFPSTFSLFSMFQARGSSLFLFPKHPHVFLIPGPLPCCSLRLQCSSRHLCNAASFSPYRSELRPFFIAYAKLLTILSYSQHSQHLHWSLSFICISKYCQYAYLPTTTPTERILLVLSDTNRCSINIYQWIVFPNTSGYGQGNQALCPSKLWNMNIFLKLPAANLNLSLRTGPCLGFG